MNYYLGCIAQLEGNEYSPHRGEGEGPQQHRADSFSKT